MDTTPHRRSYMKTTIFAAIGGTWCLVIALLFLPFASAELPGMETVLLLPFLIRVVASLIFLALALFGYGITAGGVLVLRYDAKGRAYF